MGCHKKCVEIHAGAGIDTAEKNLAIKKLVPLLDKRRLYIL